MRLKVPRCSARPESFTESGNAGNPSSSPAQRNANNNRVRTEDALGRVTTETFDGLNRLLTRSRPMGVTESIGAYDGEGRVVESTDVRGIVRKATFDLLGRQTSSTLVESLSNGGQPLLTRRTTYDDTRDSSKRTRRSDIDARGTTTTSYLDGLGRVVRVEDPSVDGTVYVQETRYDAKTKRVEQDRNGFVTKYAYDAVYRLTSQGDYESSTATTATWSETTSYDDAARKVTKVDRSGVQTVGDSDGLGRVTRTTRGVAPLQQVETHEFDALGREVRLVDANAHASSSVFDGAGRKVRATRAAGTTDKMETVSSYDAAGNVLATKSLRGTSADYDVRHSYDDLNRAVRTEDATGKVTTKAFDAAGNLECVKQMKGGVPFAHGGAAGLTVAQLRTQVCAGSFVTQYAYDEEGKQTSLTDANGNTWGFVYDKVRNLVAKRDANGHLTTFEYDARSRRTTELQHLTAQALPARDSVPGYSAPDAAFTTGTLRTRWTYDGNGNVADEVDPKGQTRRHAYGVLNRLESVTYLGHVAPRALPSIDSEAYTYTGTGQVLTVTEAKTTAAGAVTEVTTHGYDALERRETTRRYDNHLLTYGYDTKGNRTRMEDGAGEASVYTYDAADRLKTAATAAGTATYEYFEDGLLKKTTHRNGAAVVVLEETRGYDDAGRLTSLEARGTGAGQPVVAFAYGYDDNGNRGAQVETRGATVETTSYGYDDADRLVGTHYSNETHLYQLDAVGNRTGEKRALAGVVSALTVAAFAALLPANATAHVQRDFNGVDWLVAKRELVPAGATTVLRYDANGNRVEEGTRRYAWDIRDTLTQVADGASVLGTYDYDAALQRVKADTAGGHVEYVLDGKHVLRETGARTRRYHYGEGKGLAVSDGAGARWLLNDALGSVSAEVGATVVARQYDAWGNYRNATAPTAGEVRLGYTGHQYDVESGLTYARARYYDSANGVFLSRDTVEGVLTDAPSLHRWAYAHGNPLRYVDVTGRCPNCVAAGVGAGIGFVVGFGAALWDGKSVGDAAWAGAKTAVVGALAGATFGLGMAAAGGATTALMTGTATKIAVGTVASYGHQQLEIQAGIRSRVSVEDLVFAGTASAALPTGGSFSQVSQTGKVVAGSLLVASGGAAVGTGGAQVVEAMEMADSASPALKARAPWMAGLGVVNTALGLLGIGGGASMIPKATFATPASATPLLTNSVGDAPAASSSWPQAVLPSGERVPPSDYLGGYHGTDTPPEAVLSQGGFPSRGSNMNLLDHKVEVPGSGLRGTAPNAGEAALWGDWVYQFENTPTWRVNSLLEGRVPRPGGFGGSPLPGENEGAVLAGMPLGKISRYGQVTTDSVGNRVVRQWQTFKKTEPGGTDQ